MAEMTYAEKNKSRIERMLDRDPSSVKAVIANTIETKRVASKLQIIDIIFNSARQNLGYRISMEDFQKLFDKFQIADDALNSIIEEATELGIFKPREKKVSQFKQNREKIEALLDEKKTPEDIAKELNIELNKIKTWIGNIQSEKAA